MASITRDARATVTVHMCTCDEYVMCAKHEAENDAVVAAQPMYVTMMDDAGLSRLARNERHGRRAVIDDGALDRALERYGMFTTLQSERPITCPIDPMARRWNRTRVSRSAPADSMLSTTPLPAIPDGKRTW